MSDKNYKDNQEYIFDDDEQLEDEAFFEDAEDKARPILIDSGSSIFFPTFRRIEGGIFTYEYREFSTKNYAKSYF